MPDFVKTMPYFGNMTDAGPSPYDEPPKKKKPLVVGQGEGALRNERTGEEFRAQTPRANMFGATTQPQADGPSDVGARFHGVLSDQAQGGRITENENMRRFAQDNIVAEHARNAPMEREHMQKSWADEDIQRHQEQQLRELDLQRKGWEFHREQEHQGGNPDAVHWALIREKVMNDPGAYDVIKDPPGPDGKAMSHNVLKPQTKMFLDYIDGQMAGKSLQPQGTNAPPPQASTPTKPQGSMFSAALEAGAPAAATGLGWKAGAKFLAPALGRIPGVGGMLGKIAGPALGLGAGALTAGVANELDPNMQENIRAHPSSATLGGVIGALSGMVRMGRKNVPVGAGTPEAQALEQHSARTAGGVGSRLGAATGEAQRPLQTPGATPGPVGTNPSRPRQAPQAPAQGNGPAPIRRPFPGSSSGVGSITPPGERGRGFPTQEGPSMITSQMERDLLARGVTREMLNRLTPQQAWEILTGVTH